MTRLFDNLHVRVSALFLGLLVVVGVVYYLWMTRMVFAPPAQDAVAEHWYAELADAEIDSLAREAGRAPERTATLAVDYGRGIAAFEAEVVFFDLEGQVIAASDPDSLGEAVGAVDPELLRDMTDTDWAFDEIYPDPTNIDAYVNRIFHTAAVEGPQGRLGYVAATWQPLIFTEADVELDPFKLWLQAVLVGLVASFVMGWIVMSWLTRRIHRLSEAVGDLASGRLDERVRDGSRDDLGRLARDFNRMAARLEALVDDLRHKEQFQRQLIANISHDLRTPLATMRGYVETLTMRGREMPDVEYERYLRITGDNLVHLDRLVEHLLQLSRLDSGQTRFAPEDFPLPELIEGVFARVEAAAQAKNCLLSCDAPEDLPLVHADPLQIAQVLQNLVENGIKFGRDGGRVSVVLRKGERGRVSVSVRDDGPGIAPEILPHIFERFYTADESRSAKGQSSGLGLAISQKIVEAHGSQLLVTSEVGQGSAFTFDVAAEDERLAHQAEA